MSIRILILMALAQGLYCFELEDLINEQKYLLELIAVTVAVVLIYNFLVGKEKNKTLVKRFLSFNLDVFLKNFYHTGLDMKESDTIEHNYDKLVNDERIVEEDTAHFYRMYFTGRQNVKFCLASVSTKRRQDFLVSAIYSLFWPEKDKVLVECALPEDAGLKGVLYILKPKVAKKALSDYEDLQHLCKKVGVTGLNSKQLHVYAEHGDTLEFVLDKATIEDLNEYAEYIESIELSDCIENEIHKGNYIKLIMNMGKGRDEDLINISKLLTTYFALIDKLARFVPSKKTEEKFEENRKKFLARKQKDKKEEDAQNMRSEKIKNMTPAERKLYEQKQEKRQKNMMSKRYKVMKKA